MSVWESFDRFNLFLLLFNNHKERDQFCLIMNITQLVKIIATLTLQNNNNITHQSFKYYSRIFIGSKLIHYQYSPLMTLSVFMVKISFKSIIAYIKKISLSNITLRAFTCDAMYVIFLQERKLQHPFRTKVAT